MRSAKASGSTTSPATSSITARLQRYIDDYAVTGLTSNPTIFNEAIGGGAYDASIGEKAHVQESPAKPCSSNSRWKICAARPICSRRLMRGPAASTAGYRWEVSPLLSADTAGTIAAAKAIFRDADRRNLFVKIPGTPEGIPAIEEAIFAGVPINVTLLFSREHYLAAAQAYLRGIERRIAAGLDPRVESVASLFISRWDRALTDAVPAELHNRLGIAIGGHTYRAYRQLFAAPRWQQLAVQGARPQRLLWASTGTKDPKLSPSMYVEAFAAPDTVDTMPEKTLTAFAQNGKVGDAMAADGGDAETLLAQYANAGVDIQALAQKLQRDGAKAFVDSWQELMQRIATKSTALTASMTNAAEKPVISRQRQHQHRYVMSQINALAGKLPPESALENIPRLITAYYTGKPDPGVAAQRVAFGTSGHRGSSLRASFNETHIAAISQAVCVSQAKRYRWAFVYRHRYACAVRAGIRDRARSARGERHRDDDCRRWRVHTDASSIAFYISIQSRTQRSGLADGIVITPSHNPPQDGGFKYNPPNGGPADTDATDWIGAEANRLIEGGLAEVKRMPYAHARSAATTHEHDFLGAYVDDLRNVVDFEVIRSATIKLGVDPLGGAGVHYWARIAEQYKLDLDVISTTVDPTFRFMTLDWDGRIRMDPSSPYAMQRLIGLKDRYDVAFACDTDHDRHGIVARSVGLLPANHYLSVLIDYLFRNRPRWHADAGVGKTVVSSAMIDRVVARLKRRLYETPVGLKWFVSGLLDGSLGFGGEESAGATFSRIDGGVWTTDKDGIAAALLSAEITARSGRDPGEYYRDLTATLGEPISVESC